MLPNNLELLEKRLQYQFKSVSFLKKALTHCSAGIDNNERLEFLGDSILNFVIAYALIKQFPDQAEGELSRLRAFLVKGDMLAELAKELQLGDFLFLGQGELKSGGFRRASILADALEAIFAAIFLDSGLEAVERVILNLYHHRLIDDVLNQSLKDAKTELQEYLQAHKKSLPSYNLIKIEELETEPLFHIQCKIAEFSQTTHGQGANRRKAEQQAAKAMLKFLKNSL